MTLSITGLDIKGFYILFPKKQLQCHKIDTTVLFQQFLVCKCHQWGWHTLTINYFIAMWFQPVSVPVFGLSDAVCLLKVNTTTWTWWSRLWTHHWKPNAITVTTYVYLTIHIADKSLCKNWTKNSTSFKFTLLNDALRIINCPNKYTCMPNSFLFLSSKLSYAIFWHPNLKNLNFVSICNVSCQNFAFLVPYDFFDRCHEQIQTQCVYCVQLGQMSDRSDRTVVC